MSCDLKAWALAAGAFGAGVLVCAQLKQKQQKDIQELKQLVLDLKNNNISNGHSNGYANGHSNGHANGHSIGEANGAITIPTLITTNEQVLKEDLAMGHRLMQAFGMDELTGNHFSARLPGWAADDFWCTPGNLIWADIRPANLVKKSANITTNVLHTAVYQACPDALAVVHVHAPAIEAVSCLKEGVQILAQGGALLYDRIAYHDWQGISDCDDEAEDIIKSFKTSPKPARALMMRNHGAITVGKSVAEAFMLMYHLNRTCATQLAVIQSGKEINYPPKKIWEHAAKQEDEYLSSPLLEWPALKLWVENSERGDIQPLLRSNLS